MKFPSVFTGISLVIPGSENSEKLGLLDQTILVYGNIVYFYTREAK